MSALNRNPEPLAGALRTVILRQLSTQPVGFYPNNRIPGLIEIGRAAQDLRSKTVFLDRIRFAPEIPLANMFQQDR